jgi:tRNA(adenine34) deaminase
MLNKYFDILVKKAKEEQIDIPISAMITKNNQIISLKTNQREKNNSIISHAEILAIEEANKKLKSKYLSGCNMYVTLEPCPMCAWAIISSKIDNLYFGSYDINYGGFSVLKLNNIANSKIKVFGGIREEECNSILNNYFKNLRNGINK